MKIKLIITSFLMSMILFVGCKSDEMLDHSEINVSQSIVGVVTTGGSATIDLKTTADWEIVSADEDGMPDWLTISKTSGTANPEGETITFTATETTSTREAAINIVAAEKVQYVIIRQVAMTGEVVVTPASEITSNGVNGKIYYVRGKLKAITNSTYGNLVIEDASGEIATYGTLDANGGTANFESWGLAIGDEILISGPWSANYRNLNNVEIHEIVKSLLAVEPAEYEFADRFAGEVEVVVTCKKDDGFDINIDADWLSIKSIAADGEKYTIIFSAPTNETVQPRTATITFSLKGDDAATSVTTVVTQKGDEPELISVAEATAATDGMFVHIVGTVVAVNASSYIVSDGTAAMNVYRGDLEAAIGDKVKIVGEKGSYNKGAQMYNPDIEEKLESGLDVTYPAAKVIDGAAADALVAEESINIELISMTGKLSYGSYVNLYIDGAATAQGSLSNLTDEHKTLLESLHEKNITVEGYLVQISSSKYINVVITSIKEVI